MLRNYLKIALRNLIKNKVYSFINIGGLAVGMAVAMLIGLWVWDEYSYNHYHTNFERIAHVRNRYTEPLEQKTNSSNALPEPVEKVLRNKYGHLFKHIVIENWTGDYAVKVGEKNLTKTGKFMQSEVIDMLSLKMIEGNAQSLNTLQGIIISKSAAEAFFGDKNPINQTIKIDNKINGQITGIYEDLPANSTFGDIDFFGNYENIKANDADLKANENNWNNGSRQIYVQLADKVSIAQANTVIKDLFLKDSPPDYSELIEKYKVEAWLNPMKNWYLYSEFKDGDPVGGRITFVWMFLIVGVFVLFLACINFMNLSTARSEKRAKEVGIRKAVGSIKSQLISQFLSESFLVVLLAFNIALLLVVVSLTAFNELAEKRIVFPAQNPIFWSISIVFLFITTFLSGLYPAFYLSSFEPIKVLKGTIRLGKFASLPRKILVVVQFTVSVALIIGTMVVYQQIQYTQNRPIGYSQNGLVRIPMNDSGFFNNKSVIKDELLANGVATHVAFSSSPVTNIWDNWGGFTWKGKNPESESHFSVTRINEDFGKTIQWKVKQGRDFSREFGTDTSAVIINESAAKYIGLKNPIGEFITHDSDKKKRQIIGVVDDIVASSPYEPVKIGFYWLEKNPNNLSQMQIKINPNKSMNQAIEKVAAIQKKFVPSAPFVSSFVDSDYANKFNAEKQIGKLATMFAILAIFISCLGLFGLASFVAEQRTKEIGIRKVLGASVANLWQLLSKDFVVLVIISCLIAAPIAYYFMSQWLQKYEYRTEISWWVFAAAEAGALLITLLTVSYQAIKAALMNPVESLKTE